MNIPPWLTDLFATIDARDATGFASFLAEDGLFCYGSQPPVVGREAVRTHVAGFFAGMAALEHELLGHWRDAASHTSFVQGRVTYHLSDGRRVTVPFLNLMQGPEGCVERYLVYTDPTPLLPPARAGNPNQNA